MLPRPLSVNTCLRLAATGRRSMRRYPEATWCGSS